MTSKTNLTKLNAQINCEQNKVVRRRQIKTCNSFLSSVLISLSMSLFVIGLLLTLIVVSGVKSETEVTKLPDLTSATSDEPIVAIVGQDAFVSCVAKNLQNYTIIWKFSSDANAAIGAELRDLPSPPSANIQTNPTNGASTIASSNSRDQSTNSSNSSKETTEIIDNNSNNSDEFESVQPSGEFASVILTAGRQRVTSDERFSVIRSHDTWLLKIKDAQLADTGSYICETNSAPPVRAIRVLSVVTDGSEASVEVEGL